MKAKYCEIKSKINNQEAPKDIENNVWKKLSKILRNWQGEGNICTKLVINSISSMCYVTVWIYGVDLMLFVRH